MSLATLDHSLAGGACISIMYRRDWLSAENDGTSTRSHRSLTMFGSISIISGLARTAKFDFILYEIYPSRVIPLDLPKKIPAYFCCYWRHPVLFFLKNGNNKSKYFMFNY
jgi:hypothetical protein